ncbi:coiled-coil domain-containing protein 171 isoform X2 [Brachyhypopomus gauderio]|uniref:coiled-coil domain-containing protein 171 isoform X2 n=1 Tax=Brachyhypopomus gauderio TaxID=698409 RepID=UPI004041BA20
MSTGPPSTRQRHEDRVRDRTKRRDGGQPKAALRASRPRATTQPDHSSLEDVNRLREVIGQLHREGCGSEKEEELRWKVTQLERDKLEQTAKYNQEVSAYEAQLARLRALLERGEAHRQTLEYEVAVAKRDASLQKTSTEDKMAVLLKHNQQLEGLSVELRQRACDLERALEITGQAREEEQQGLQAELRERDRLLHSTSAENHLLQADKSQLQTLLQEQKDTLQKLQERLSQTQRERNRQTEELRVKTSELKTSTDRVEELRREVESAMLRIKDMEENVESERAAHLESKFNSEIIQLRLREVEASLSLEKSGCAEAELSLQLIRQKFGELEKAYTHERECVQNTQHTLQQLEKEYLSTKTDLIGQLDNEKAASAGLIGQLEQEKAESAKLSLKLQEQERGQMQNQQELNLVQKELGCVQGAYETLLKEMEQLLQHYHHQGAPQASCTEDGDKCSPSVLMDILRRTLHQYHTELKDLVKVVEMLNSEIKDKEQIITEQRRTTQECEARCACVCEEVKRLRRNVADAAAAVERAQIDLQSVTHSWEEEKERHTHTKTKIHTLTQEHERDQQAKLAILHSLYQRLVAGCVIVDPPQSMLGSFSWVELATLLQEHVDILTSDLHSANQKVSYLERVCEGKTAALERVCEQLKQREETWIKQREELDTQHTHTTNDLHSRAQDLKSQLEQAEETVRISERALSDLRQDVTQLQDLLSVCRRDGASLLAACGLLAGCVCALHGRVCVLARQKDLLWNRACDGWALRQEVGALLHALGEPGVRGHAEGRGGVWGFRCGVIAVLAALRLQALGRSSHTLFRVCGGYGDRPSVCVRQLRLKGGTEWDEEEEENSRVMKMLRSPELSVIIHTCMQGVGEELDKTECGSGVLAAAQNSFANLLERLLAIADSDCRGHCGDLGSLAWQLGQGLHRLHTNQHIPQGYYTSKCMVSSLQQHFLGFTQRLHSAEVERRDLRIELSRLKQSTTHPHSDPRSTTHPHSDPRNTTHDPRNTTHPHSDPRSTTHPHSDPRNTTHDPRNTTHPHSDPRSTHTACVPVSQFRGVCEELSAALQREQKAQTLLHQQATQLQELGLTMELHTGDQLEKEHTLTQAVQSLSEVKAELRRKEQSLRLLGKRLSQSQQEKQKLQQNINSAECALRMAAKKKNVLSSYMRSVEAQLKELKDGLILSRFTTSKEDFTLHLPTMHMDIPGLGGPEIAVCQTLVQSFLEVYQLACSRMASLEREVSCHQSHMTALKRELQDACLRENQSYVPVISSNEPQSPLNKAEGDSGTTPFLDAGVSLTTVPGNMRPLNSKPQCCQLKTTRTGQKAPRNTTVHQEAFKP